MYSTDNGPHMNSWPDAGMTPFRNEKNSNWEGAYRVPALVRWPGMFPAGTVLNGIVSHNDWFVTLLAAAGVTDIAERLRAGTDLNGTTFKVHLDGHDQFDYITGAADESPRKHFFYVSDDGDLTALRYDNWKFVFMEQRVPGTLKIWARAVCRAARDRSCSTCAPTPTSGPTSRRTPTTTGCSTTSSCSSRRRHMSRRCCRRSSSSRSGRSRRVSTSSRCWRNCRQACPTLENEGVSAEFVDFARDKEVVTRAAVGAGHPRGLAVARERPDGLRLAVSESPFRGGKLLVVATEASVAALGEVEPVAPVQRAVRRPRWRRPRVVDDLTAGAGLASGGVHHAVDVARG